VGKSFCKTRFLATQKSPCTTYYPVPVVQQSVAIHLNNLAVPKSAASGGFRGAQLALSAAKPTAKCTSQNTATYYTTKTSKRQAFFGQNFWFLEKTNPASTLRQHSPDIPRIVQLAHRYSNESPARQFSTDSSPKA
jgi:hypothetical protein